MARGSRAGFPVHPLVVAMVPKLCGADVLFPAMYPEYQLTRDWVVPAMLALIYYQC